MYVAQYFLQELIFATWSICWKPIILYVKLNPGHRRYRILSFKRGGGSVPWCQCSSRGDWCGHGACDWRAFPAGSELHNRWWSPASRRSCCHPRVARRWHRSPDSRGVDCLARSTDHFASSATDPNINDPDCAINKFEQVRNLLILKAHFLCNSPESGKIYVLILECFDGFMVLSIWYHYSHGMRLMSIFCLSVNNAPLSYCTVRDSVGFMGTS